MLPYNLIILVLLKRMQRNDAPAELGRPYIKGERLDHSGYQRVNISSFARHLLLFVAQVHYPVSFSKQKLHRLRLADHP